MPEIIDTNWIDVSGELLSEDVISTLRNPEAEFEYAQPDTFHYNGFTPESQTDLERELGSAWETLKQKWDAFQSDIEETGKEDLSVSDVRQRWVLPLFRELGFEPEYLQSAREVHGTTYNLSHRGWDDSDAPIIHSVEPDQPLDEKIERETRTSYTPHNLVQEFLNQSDEHLWAILTNGFKLRILRDFYHEVTKGYVEFDLEQMFEDRNLQDFRALYRLAHRSRFHSEEDDQDERLEQIFDKSKEIGVTAGKDLRENVRNAIEVLANGFLAGENLSPYKDDPDKCEELYHEVLIIIYRILFLLYAEQRGMVPSEELASETSTEENWIDVYMKEYSLKSLRNRAESARTGDDRNVDLWLGLKQTFRMLREGREEMGIYSYNGELFSEEKVELLQKYSCKNKHLLEAIRYLTLIEQDGIKQRINFARLGVGEIGAIYENLLDYQPRVMDEREELDETVLPANKFVLDPRGTERKGSGSYYTNPNLVDQLIETALKPVVEDRLQDADTKEEKIQAIRHIDVCDPACGSGAFLIKANNYLGKVLAEIQSGEQYPSDRELMEAKREVLQHCIYGVDLNPMAVELARVSLWINATVQDKPLNYLDHRIKVGNSLIGTLPDTIDQGITQEHFSLDYIPEGDDRELVKDLRKTCREENKLLEKAQNLSLFQKYPDIAPDHVQEIEEIPEDTVQQISEKKEKYAEYTQSDRYQEQKFIHDLWTASFFWENTKEREWYPTPMNFREAQNNPEKIPTSARQEIQRLAEENRFFHWHIEFPEIFETDDPGFDCVLGNPPWGKVEFEETKFFAGRDSEIENTDTKSRRAEKIKQLEDKNPELFSLFKNAKRSVGCQSKFLRASGRYPYTGKGKLNTYTVFAELDRDVINDAGRAGIVIPSGLATDKTTAEFFRDLMENNQVASMYDFENREGLFPEVHRSYKFSLLTLCGEAHGENTADFAFFLTNLDQLNEGYRHFTLVDGELKLLNPNTRTCPVFRSKQDADLTKRLYRQAPVLINEEDGQNPWSIRFSQGLFNMASDSHLFKTSEELESNGYELKGNHFVGEDTRYLPLYEAKMIHQFHHRFGDYLHVSKRAPTSIPTPENSKLKNPEFKVTPWYWVSESDVNSELENWDKDWLLVFRKTARNNDKRTMISCIIPKAGVNDKAPIIFSQKNVIKQTCLLSNFNSFVFDFAVRNKLGGTDITHFYMKQFPVLSPEQYDEELRFKIVKRAIPLIWNSDELNCYVDEIIDLLSVHKWNEWFPEKKISNGDLRDPFVWNEERRFQLRCELDAMYAHLYNVTEEELDYILDTFPIVKRKDEEEYGTYRTKEAILENYQSIGF